MDDLVETLTAGNPTEVKVVLASVALALGVYQVVLIAVGYGRLRPRVLDPPPASRAHRAIGDCLAVLLVVVAVMCVAYFGIEDDAVVHSAAGITLLAVLALKVAVVRWWHGLGAALPYLGTTVLVLLAITWATSAGGFLADGG